MLDSRKSQFRRWFPVVLATSVLAIVYVLTLQRDINGSDHEYTLDVGEIQIALNLWGTIHHTGYPLHTFLASLLTATFRILGANPATAASSASMVFGLAAAVVFFDLVRLRTGQSAVALVATLAFGFTQGLWLHSVIAEVYSFYILMAALIAWWVFKDDRQWQMRDWLTAALLLGLGLGHHRATAFMVLALAVWLLPQIWQARRRMPLILVAGTGVAVATLIVYIYLPLRTLAGAQWLSEPAANLGQLWRVATAQEADFLFVPPRNHDEWSTNLGYVAGGLAQQLTVAGLIAGVATILGLIIHAPARRFGLALLIGLAAYIPFPVMFPKIVPVAGFMLPAVMFVLLALAEGLSLIGRIRTVATWARMPITAAGLCLASVLFAVNLSFVTGIVRNPSGREVINAVSNLRLDDFEGEPVLMLGRGMLYYAVYYGLNVTHEIDGITLIDHRDSPAAFAARGQPILTVPISFYIFPADWWTDRLGGFHLSSVGEGFVQVAGEPRNTGREWPDEPVRSMENGVTLLAYEIRDSSSPGNFRLALWWRADRTPLDAYSIYVHLACVQTPDSPDDIILSADSAVAVYGWYGTEQWSIGEVVREDYVLAATETCAPLFLRVGMYRQQSDGSFQNFDALVLPLD